MASSDLQDESLAGRRSASSHIRRKPSTRLPGPSQDLRNQLIASIRPTQRSTSENLRQTSKAVPSARKPVAPPRSTTPLLSVAPPRTPVARPPQEDDTMTGTLSPPPSHYHYLARPTPSVKTPSLVSGSSVSAYDSPRSALRRKPSTINRYALRAKTDPDIIQEPRELVEIAHDTISDPFPGDVLGISLPPTIGVGCGKKYAGDSTMPTGLSKQTMKSPPALQPSALPDTVPRTSTKYQPRTPAAPRATPASMPLNLSKMSSSRTATRTPQESLVENRPPVPQKDCAPTQTNPTPARKTHRYSSQAPIEAVVDDVTTAKVRPTQPERARTAGPTLPSSPAAFRKTYTSQPPVKVEPALKSNTKQTVSTSRVIQIPPELAHLNVDPPVQSPPKPYPPRRPSRDGIPGLMEYQGPSPVVQSNLPPLYTSYHKRTPSSETPVLAASPATSASRRLFGFSPRSSSRQASPKVDSAISPPPSARLFASGKSADTKDIEAQIRRGDSPALGPAPSPSKSPRFGFLSKRPKDGQQKLEKSEKKLRRGPAAGTGHEGYGRFGLRGRSASTFSGSSADRSTSADSAASSIARTSRKGSVFTQDESDLDDFLKERLTPVVLRGNGSSSSVGASTGNGGISEIKAGAAVASPTASSVYSDDSPQIGALPLGLIIRSNSQSRPLMGFRKTSGDSESGASASQPSLTARHSARRSQLLGGSDDISTPISTEPSMTAPNDAKAKRGSVTSLTKNREPLVEGNESLRLKPKRTDTLVKGPRKWNFFQRAHASSNTLRKEEPKYQNTAHYALIDTEPVDLDEVEQLVQEDRAGGVATDSTEPVELPKVIPYERRHSTLLPSPRAARKEEPRTDKPSPPKLLLRTDSAESPELLRAQTARPAKSPQIVDIPASPMLPPGPPVPRLSPVGRIPRVVSKRDRERKLPDQSFSRPFAKSQPRPTVKPPGTLYTEIRHLASPVESQPNSSTTGPSEIPSIEARGTTPTDPSSASVRATPFTDITTPADEFIAFPPRKNSELSYTSSSGTASIPDPRYGGPGLHGEEDVWHEYNDLLDEVMPQKTPLSAGSSLGAPFQYADPESDNEERHPKRKRLPHLPVQYGLGLDTSVAHQFAPSVEASKAPRHLSASLQPLTLPSSPYSISEIVSGYDERTTSMTGSTVRHSLPSGQRSSLADSRTSLPASRRSQGSTHTRSLSVPDASSLQPLSSSAPHIRDSRIPSIVEDDSKDPMTEINLRYGALMTSKWLSFGRVLFSPAHIEAESGDNVKVLVVDGLGKDWSYYCAMTYPTATFYNLGPDSATEPSVADPAGWKPLTNHRQIQHLSMSDPFPFPKGFFSAVVLRFPQATSDKVFHQCIYECKRVLQPGGYLEISALDLDLMSMGTRARKAVMNLKMRMQQADSNVSLRNLGDVMMRLVGRRGFENIQRCVVGVPAAGRIPRSQDMSSISSGSSSKKGKERAMSIVHEPSNASLADLVNDAPATAITGFTDSNDEGITKMVAKVGRWWYSTCYESAVTATTNPPSDSIWDTPGLLRECERHGTSFRLLICYAQKPTCAKRRTVSV